MLKNIIKYLFVGSLAFTACKSGKQSLSIENLKVEGRVNPIAVEDLNPRFGWQILSNKRNVQQQAYRIVVSRSKEDLAETGSKVWDSGKINADLSQQLPFQGEGLKSYDELYWKVMVWTNQGDSVWSEINNWKMALLSPDDWKANWIGLDTFSNSDKPQEVNTKLAARYVRKELAVHKDVLSATAYISGLGLYEFHINGEKVGEDVLAPTLTDYNLRVPYNSYDVTSMIKKGNNALAVVLGNGRFFQMRNFQGKPNPLTSLSQIDYGLPRLLMQIRVLYKDGTSEIIASDGSWKVTDQGPIRANNEYDGEEYDARMELLNWDKTGFDDNSWANVDLMEKPAGKLFSQQNENIKVKESVKPISIHKTTRGTYILDMGQNMVGWLKIKAKANQDDVLKMVFAERRLNEDSIYIANLRTAEVTDTYIFKDDKPITWHPSFTYHGFQYVEISGLKSEPKLDDFEGQVVYDDVEMIGQFNSSNETLNQIFKNASWTIRGNYRGIPTDCPQRDERVAWLGDRIMSSYGESFLFDNARFYAKWMADVEVSQKENGSIADVVPAFWLVENDNVTYPSAFIIIPEMLRKQYADENTYKKYYPNMKKWMNYMWDTYAQDNLILKDVYGDWCVAPEENSNTIWTNDPQRTTDGGLVAASYYYYCLNLMKDFAKYQGLTADEQFFDQRANNLKIAFNKKFFHADSLYYSNNTTTANLLPLTFNLVDDQHRDAVFQHILEKTKSYGNHIHTGIMGAMWFMRGLTDHGKANLAYEVATKKTYPSWGYMIEKGATTIWELWNGNTGDPLMNSWNHQMLLGDLLIWYYEYLAGIKSDPVKTGFKEILMRPIFPEGLDFVDASYQTIYGQVKSNWKKTNPTELTWNIEIPANSKAKVYLPTASLDQIQESGKAISEHKDFHVLESSEKYVLIEIGSGAYHFVVSKPIW